MNLEVDAQAVDGTETDILGQNLGQRQVCEINGMKIDISKMP